MIFEFTDLQSWMQGCHCVVALYSWWALVVWVTENAVEAPVEIQKHEVDNPVTSSNEQDEATISYSFKSPFDRHHLFHYRLRSSNRS